jgi:DNA topoisomerase-1
LIDSQAAARRNITVAVKRVARELGNAPAVCRSTYIHPEILNCYLEGCLVEHLTRQIKKKLRGELDGLSSEEAAVFVLLLNRLEAAGAA